ncbi:unnamed protein product [Sphagnum troendelagicum]|uniref:Mechanosensitive ion channel MscS domain-containing protein n=1 Tax=Sphagnum troendelagicum TaxID=128251 RepID=A0ABP0UZB0_9BRYO
MEQSVSAWTLMRLMKVVRTNNLSMFSYTSMLSADWEIVSVPMAKSAAKQIFENMADPDQNELMLKNFMKFLPPDKATQAFASFEVTLNGTITKQALVKWVVDVFKERKSLSLTLNDNRTVIIKINQLLDAVLIAGICAVSFMIMGFNSQTLLVCNSSLLIPAVAVFGNMARTTFESIVFLFVIHPFDVGDRVSVEGVPLLVEEMNIFSTIFLNGANEKISYPNSLLATKPITNVHRSPDQWDLIEIRIDSTTNVPKIGILQDRLNRYIESLPEIWYPRWRFVVKDIDDSSHLNMYITIQHHINFQDGGERWQRRSNMILHLENLMNELEISYKLPPAQIDIKAGTIFTEDPLIPISHAVL